MRIESARAVFVWRGPAPSCFVAVPEAEGAEVRAIASAVAYGWGMIPARVRVRVRVRVRLGATA